MVQGLGQLLDRDVQGNGLLLAVQPFPQEFVVLLNQADAPFSFALDGWVADKATNGSFSKDFAKFSKRDSGIHAAKLG